jgi:hypothetical protein
MLQLLGLVQPDLTALTIWREEEHMPLFLIILSLGKSPVAV